VAQRMAGHALVGGITLQQGVAGAQFNRGTHQGVGYAVEVALKFDVVVDVNFGRFPDLYD
jgi:hypothetical protein